MSQKKGLNIIIVGCGKVGISLVEQLSKEGHDITIIDSNNNKIQEITNLYDVIGLTGNGASYSVQMEAGISNADLLISVTGSDELNLLCCTIARQVGKCAAIARVRTPDYSLEADYLRNKLGLAMIINPELETAKQIKNILCLPTALEVNPFAHNQAEMIKYELPENSILNDVAIMDMHKISKHKILICAVERQGEVYIPTGTFVLKAGDTISFVAQNKSAKSFLEDIGSKTTKVKDAMIIGGGKVAFYLAELLLKRGISVKIIESDRERCDELSVLLPKAIIINGDGTDEELLKEAGIQYTESFVPLTGMDEENIILTLYAKKTSDAKVVTKINRINFRKVIESLGLGSVIYPRYITTEAIIAYVRAKKNSLDRNIETLYHMFDSRVEAIEFRVGDVKGLTGIALKDLKLKKNILVSLINRKGKILIPNGLDSILPGDSVVIVTSQSGLGNIDEILQ